MKILLPHGTSTIENAMRSLHPEVVLLAAPQFNGLFERLKGKISHKGWMGKRRFLTALKTGELYYQTLDSGKKPGIWLSWRFKQSRKLLRNGILKKLNPYLKAILLIDKGISVESITFLLQIDIPVYADSGELITPENRKNHTTLNPVSTPFVIRKNVETEVGE
jgi:hypothetical protein